MSLAWYTKSICRIVGRSCRGDVSIIWSIWWFEFIREWAIWGFPKRIYELGRANLQNRESPRSELQRQSLFHLANWFEFIHERARRGLLKRIYELGRTHEVDLQNRENRSSNLQRQSLCYLADWFESRTRNTKTHTRACRCDRSL